MCNTKVLDCWRMRDSKKSVQLAKKNIHYSKQSLGWYHIIKLPLAMAHSYKWETYDQAARRTHWKLLTNLTHTHKKKRCKDNTPNLRKSRHTKKQTTVKTLRVYIANTASHKRMRNKWNSPKMSWNYEFLVSSSHFPLLLKECRPQIFRQEKLTVSQVPHFKRTLSWRAIDSTWLKGSLFQS